MNNLKIFKSVLTFIFFIFLISSNTNVQAQLTFDPKDESDCNCTLQWKGFKNYTILEDITDRVGIGTNAPSSKLHVINPSSTNIPAFLLKQEVNDKAALNVATNGYGIFAKSSHSNEKYLFRLLNSGNQFILNAQANGKVGIGTSNVPDDYKLAVDGKVIAEGVKVQLNEDWADYVFEEDYSRNSLAEVEDYIQSNKHLPNVPSAQEVEEAGIDLGSMDATLLRQIEELWLHLIDIEKENKDLQTRLKVLEKY